VLLAAVLRRRTSVGVNWIAERLAMGHPGSVSRMLGAIQRDGNARKRLGELEKMLISGD
jgi:putative transposase